MRVSVRTVAAGGLAAALIASAAGPASAATTAVSPPSSPYATAGCSAVDQTPGSLNYVNSEVEPQATVDPTNAQHLVGAWQQDRWSDGGSHGLVAAYSRDGGTSWTLSPQPFSACYHESGFAGPYLDYQRASDPWVSIGPGAPGNPSGSTVYSVSVSFDFSAYKADPDGSHNAVGAAASYDGGATWSHVQTLIADACDNVPSPCNAANVPFNDKESVTADPTRPGVAYAVWDRLTVPRSSPRGFVHERAYKGPTMLSKTTDYGVTWSAPQVAVRMPSQDQTIGNVIVVDPSGTLFDFFDLIQNASNKGGNRGDNVAFATSTDAGATWSKPQVVAGIESAGVSDPNNVDLYSGTPPAPLRTGDDLPEAAVNPRTGQLYVVWQDDRFNGGSQDEVVISTSSDHGATWSPPARVNDHTGQPAYDPSVAVTGTGAVAVSYFQWTGSVRGNEPTLVLLKRSTSAGSSTTAPTFGSATVVDGPDNGLAAPYAGGYFLGDYQGLVATSGATVVPFYARTTCADGGPTTQPSCRAAASVLPPVDPTPTGFNSTDVYAAPVG